MFVKHSWWQFVNRLGTPRVACSIPTTQTVVPPVSPRLRRKLRLRLLSVRGDRRQLLVVSVCSSLLFAGLAHAATPAAPPATTNTKTATASITGELSSVSSGVIAVTYKQAAGHDFEMLLPVDKATRFEHARSLKEFVPGDTVQVQYEQTYTDGRHGERVILKTLATSVALVKHGTQQALRSTEPKSP